MLGLSLGCSDTSQYSNHQSIPGRTWHKNDTIWFEVPQDSTVATGTKGTVQFYLRHGAEYVFEDIQIKVLEEKNGILKEEARAFRIPLVNKEGLWLGKSKGLLYENINVLWEGFEQLDSGSYRIGVLPNMPNQQSLSYISNVGIKITNK